MEQFWHWTFILGISVAFLVMVASTPNPARAISVSSDIIAAPMRRLSISFVVLMAATIGLYTTTVAWEISSEKSPPTWAVRRPAPPAALEYLQQHPESVAEFRAKYGYVPASESDESYLRSHPEAAPKFRATFGYLPKDFGRTTPAKRWTFALVAALLVAAVAKIYYLVSLWRIVAVLGRSKITWTGITFISGVVGTLVSYILIRKIVAPTRPVLSA
ncbi:MAG TPA: hypothetical protein VFA75_08585 [Nevskia sp.]|nr:hypothetical protein [Nevskia sp.]